MPVFNNILAGAAGSGGAAAYEIERSLRFNSGDSAYLERTPGLNGSQTTATWSFWVKRAALGVETTLFGFGANSTTDGMIQFTSGDVLQVFFRKNVTKQVDYKTAALFRDTSAWYHIVVRIDTTVATTVKIWVNGAEVSDWAATPTNATVNDTVIFNSTSYANYIGKWRGDTNPDTNAYLADVHFIDGQALAASDFGEYDDNGVWQPKRYSGTYGTNGFHLDFSDNSSTTSGSNAGIGKDVSGNGNYFDSNGISVTSGVGNDSLFDSPTNGTQSDTGAGGEVSGNYCTLNPVARGSYQTATISNGNLDASFITNRMVESTIAVSSGKWYYEEHITSTPSNTASTLVRGFENSNLSNTSFSWRANGQTQGLTGSPTLSTYTNGDVLGIAVDVDNTQVTFYKNGTQEGTYTYSTFGSTFLQFGAFSAGTADISFNFGQRAFIYTAPTGYKALCTANLDAPEITKPSSVFDVKLYTGDESTQPITGFDFSPDLVLRKGRYKPGVGGTPSGVTESNHWLAFDTVRTAGKRLILSNNSQEDTGSTTLTAFTSDGFTLGSSTDGNDDPQEYTAVCFDAGDAASPTSVSVGGLNPATDQSRTWSGDVTGTAYSSSYVITNGFDNDLATRAGGDFTFTPPNPIACTKVRIYMATYADDGNGNTPTGKVYLNGVDIASQIPVTSAYAVPLEFTPSNNQFVSYQCTGDGDEPGWFSKIELLINGEWTALIDSNVTITDVPSLASTYRANPSAGFSIVTYTGGQTSGDTVAHGLNAKPAMMWVKTRDTAGGWFVYHEGLHNTAPEDYYLELNNNSSGIPASPDAGAWNSTQPTSSIFTLGNYESVNDLNGGMVAYLWSRVEGFSEFGYYTGTGANDGPFIYTGFAPKFVLTRAVSTGSEWLIWDKAREPYNVKTRSMHMDAENESGYGMDFLSNGFKTRVNYGSSSNNSSTRYLWAAFADNPFQQNGGIAV